MLLVAVAFGLFWLLVEEGAPRWLAVVVGILAAVSLEPTSYARRTLPRLRDR